MSRNIEEAHFSAPPEGNNVTYYFVGAGLAGHVNAHAGIAQRPNTNLVFNPDRPLGQHSLHVLLLSDLASGREVLIAYGARHALMERMRRGPKLKTLNKRRVVAGEAAGDA